MAKEEVDGKREEKERIKKGEWRESVKSPTLTLVAVSVCLLVRVHVIN
jgi:hypothetical protein